MWIESDVMTIETQDSVVYTDFIFLCYYTTKNTLLLILLILSIFVNINNNVDFFPLTLSHIFWWSSSLDA